MVEVNSRPQGSKKQSKTSGTVNVEAYAAATGNSGTFTKREIRITYKEEPLDHHVRDVEKALIAAECPVYVRGGSRLVWPAGASI